MKALVLIALVALVIAVVLYLRKKPARVAQPPAPEDPFKADTPVGGDPRNIRAGDVIEYLGQTYAVRGTVHYTEGPYRWTEHYLDDSRGTRRWISVEEDPDLEVVMWTELSDSGLSPDNKTLHHGEVQYARHERGTAQYVSSGTTGLQPSGHVDYVDFHAPHGRRLSFERFGDASWEAGSGEVVATSVLTIYPATRLETD